MKIVAEFQTFVKLQNLTSVPDNIALLTGITTEMTQSGLSFINAIKAFYDFIDDGIIIGYNISSYDINFLNYHIIKNQLPIRRLYNDFFDVKTFAAKKGFANISLKDLAKILSVPPTTSHRALDDCYTTFDVFNKLCILPTIINKIEDDDDIYFDDLEDDLEDDEFEYLSDIQTIQQRKINYIKSKKLHPQNNTKSFHKYIENLGENCFKDKKVVISGKFNEFSIKERGYILNCLGCCSAGRSNVSKKTDFLILGEDFGPAKFIKAKKYGTTIIDREKFFEMIGYKELK